MVTVASKTIQKQLWSHYYKPIKSLPLHNVLPMCFFVFLCYHSWLRVSRTCEAHTHVSFSMLAVSRLFVMHAFPSTDHITGRSPILQSQKMYASLVRHKHTAIHHTPLTSMRVGICRVLGLKPNWMERFHVFSDLFLQGNQNHKVKGVFSLHTLLNFHIYTLQKGFRRPHTVGICAN